MSEIKRLRMLIELNRLGTISAVAEALSYSTSGVSQQLGQLERDMCAVLLEPEGRRLRLTAAGHALVRTAPRVLDAWDEARTTVAIADTHVAGQVRVAMFQTALLALGAELSLRLRNRYPDLDLSIVQSEPEQSVPATRAREVDLALIERYPGFDRTIPQGLTEVPVHRDAMHLAVPENSARGVDLASLADSPWAMEERGSQARSWAEAQCRRAGFEPHVVFETPDMVAQCDLVCAGAAVAFVPALIPSAYTAGVRVVRDDAVQARELGLVCREGAEEHPALAAVRDAIIEILAGR